jgi:hypothetical protein
VPTEVWTFQSRFVGERKNKDKRFLSNRPSATMSVLQSHPAWQVLLDKNTNKPYYYNRSANINTYTVPDDLLTPAQVRDAALVFQRTTNDKLPTESYWMVANHSRWR